MRQRLLIFTGFIFLIVVLIGLNAATYVQKEKMPDSELTPNRSTYNSGTTGTKVFYTLLNETGRKVVRWQEPPDALLTATRDKPSTFVVVGPLRREFDETEITQLLRWVAEGGRLVIVDRMPPEKLLTTTANWKISISESIDIGHLTVDASDQKQMTSNVKAARPAQPTALTINVNAVQPSRFVSRIELERFTDSGKKEGIPSIAPVVHFTGKDDGGLLIDVPFEQGEIIYLADPYIISNGGINLVDNARLGINIVRADDGIVAFDEYHQGYGANNNRFFQYFEGTPVIAIFLQCLVFAAALFFSQSRRFARPLPEKEPDRLSKLEYVAAMAELQRRTQARDLAIENIYTDFRRRVARAFGVDNFTTTRKEIAALISERIKLDPNEIEDVMFKCEDIMHGEPTNNNEVVRLTGKLREFETKLGLKRTAKKKI